MNFVKNFLEKVQGAQRRNKSKYCLFFAISSINSGNDGNRIYINHIICKNSFVVIGSCTSATIKGIEEIKK